MSSQSAGCATRANTKERGRKKRRRKERREHGFFNSFRDFSFFHRQFSSRPVAATYADAAYLNFHERGGRPPRRYSRRTLKTHRAAV